jgi:16S rRNA processing protein RimM
LSEVKTHSADNYADQRFFVVAKITGCFGVKGKLKIQIFSKDRFNLKNISDVRIGLHESEAKLAQIEDVEDQHKSVVISIRGISDKDTALSFIGQLIFVDEKNIESPKQGRYFVHDVIGCKVYSTRGDLLGFVEDVLKLPAQDIWVINRGQDNFYLPVVKEFIRDVDVKMKKIIIDPVEGLMNE